MRYRLRTLMIAVALVPPVLAGVWLVCREVVRNVEQTQRIADELRAEQQHQEAAQQPVP